MSYSLVYRKMESTITLLMLKVQIPPETQMSSDAHLISHQIKLKGIK